MRRKRQKISRRDFLLIAGLASAAAPAAPISPSRHTKSEEELTVDRSGKTERPWWVRTVDKPTVEINWEEMQRFDARDATRGQGFARYVGQVQAELLDLTAARNEQKRILEDVPGYTLKDQAMRSAQQYDTRTAFSFLGPRNAPTPQERGVPKWRGTALEAAQMLRVALRHFGAATVGFVELDERTRKLVYSYDLDGKQLIFEETDAGYETVDKRVIPLHARWVIVYTVQMSQETLKRAPTATAAQTTDLAYNRGAHIQNRAQEFLRGLGYQCLGEATANALGIAPAFAVMAGLGELSRLNRLITPEYGPMVRVFKMITDLPLAADRPIDAGIIEFCKHCKKCAEACPPGALSLDDDPGWEIKGGWSNPGHQAYFEDSVRCRTYMRQEVGTNCGICFAVCPFSKKDRAWIHNWVKASVSRLPALDGFFRSMDDAFSYGAKKDPTAWWSLDQPEYGIDTERTSD